MSIWPQSERSPRLTRAAAGEPDWALVKLLPRPVAFLVKAEVFPETLGGTGEPGALVKLVAFLAKAEAGTRTALFVAGWRDRAGTAAPLYSGAIAAVSP